MSENDLRQVRAAKNQTLFREVNDRLVDLNEAFDAMTGSATFVCECADLDCIQEIEMTLDEYEDIRRDPHRFFVAPTDEHFDSIVERLVEKRGAYWIVEKVGVAAKVVEEGAAR